MRTRIFAGLLLFAGLQPLLPGAADWNWNLPKGFPRPPVPASNPMTAAKVELGRYLFYDKRLSGNETQSCATCHRQELAFTDGRPHAKGSTGQFHPRSSMSLVNIAYATRLTWADPDLDSLELQALTPMFGQVPVELGLKGLEQQFLGRLRGDPLYQRLFPLAFPDNPAYTIENVTKAIAAFERTIVSMRSPYDRFRWGGEASALSESAKRGEIVFSSSERGRCFQCHGGWNFSSVRFQGQTAANQPGGDNTFFNTGATLYLAPNRGLFEHTHKSGDIGKFRVPTLRNIAVTGPYMHDGSYPTLEAVIDHYAAGGRLQDPGKSRILRPLTLTAGDKQDLIEFLQSLTDEEMLYDQQWSDPWLRLREEVR